VDGLSTVVVVHETVAPSVRRLLALCDEHAAILKRARWAGVDEIVGFSTVMECEACALTQDSQANLSGADPTSSTRRSHLRPVPASQ
jgi:hypothetical protein